MKKNLGNIDRIVRALFTLIVAVLYFTGIINGTVAIILGVAALILLLTSVVTFCPIYAILKLSSRKNEE